MKPLDRVLRRLQGVKERSGEQFMALCPAHDDHDPSLSVTVSNDGKILIHCFAGCSTQAVVDALGLRITDLFPDKREF